MSGIIQLIHLQDFLAADNHKRLIYGEPQHFIRREDRPFAYAAGFPKLRCVVGNAPGTELLGLAGYGNAGKPGAGGNKFRSQRVGAS